MVLLAQVLITPIHVMEHITQVLVVGFMEQIVVGQLLLAGSIITQQIADLKQGVHGHLY